MERFEFMDGSYYEFDPAIFSPYNVDHYSIRDRGYVGYKPDPGSHHEWLYVDCIESPSIRAARLEITNQENSVMKVRLKELSAIENTPETVNKRIVGVVLTVSSGYGHLSPIPVHTILPVGLKYMTGYPRAFIDFDNWQGKLITYKSDGTL